MTSALKEKSGCHEIGHSGGLSGKGSEKFILNQRLKEKCNRTVNGKGVQAEENTPEVEIGLIPWTKVNWVQEMGFGRQVGSRLPRTSWGVLRTVVLVPTIKKAIRGF